MDAGEDGRVHEGDRGVFFCVLIHSLIVEERDLMITTEADKI